MRNRREAEAGPVIENLCCEIMGKRPIHRCLKLVHAEGRCKRHHTLHVKREEKDAEIRAEVLEAERQRDLRNAEVLARFMAMADEEPPDWFTIIHELNRELRNRIILGDAYALVLDRLAMRHPAGHREAMRLFQNFGRMAWDLFRHENVVAGPAPIPHIADDAQSVHRAEVSEQTNRGIKIILSTPVPPGQDTLAALLYAWVSFTSHTSVQVMKILEDVDHWYKQSYCIEPGDFYYKKLLDHSVALINVSRNRSDLFKRLYEEATESADMCCIGHINRIVNAFVGIVDGFDCPVSTKEILQTRLAAIAMTAKSTEEKQKDARIVLTELRIPEEEHAVWLEAF
jgi:hypothetical protein